MTKALHPIAKLVEQFEVPEEYHHALWEAYSEGAKRGFIDASIRGLLGDADTDLKPSDKERSSGPSKSPTPSSPISRKGQT